MLTLQEMAEFFKGPGEPTRIRILGVLRHGELCVCDIMAVLDLPQSTASRHLTYLRKAGWLTSRRENKWMYYALLQTDQNRELISGVLGLIAGIPDIQRDYLSMKKHLAEKTGRSRKK